MKIPKLGGGYIESPVFSPSLEEVVIFHINEAKKLGLDGEQYIDWINYKSQKEIDAELYFNSINE